MTALGFLRITALLEGVSYLLLLFVGMPLKYVWHLPTPNLYIGAAHGALFVLYVVLVIWVKFRLNWALTKTGWALLASVIPFGTFWAEVKLFRT